MVPLFVYIDNACEYQIYKIIAQQFQAQSLWGKYTRYATTAMLSINNFPQLIVVVMRLYSFVHINLNSDNNVAHL